MIFKKVKESSKSLRFFEMFKILPVGLHQYESFTLVIVYKNSKKQTFLTAIRYQLDMSVLLRTITVKSKFLFAVLESFAEDKILFGLLNAFNISHIRG